MPESEVPKVGLGTVYLQKGDFASAVNSCQQALDLNPESDYARVHLAEALLFQNKSEAAKIELKKVIEKSPDSAYSRTADNLLKAIEQI